MPLEPANVTYELRLPRMAPRILFLNTVSLLPGTLSSELAEDQLVVHVLDCSQPVLQDLAILEERIADIFGVVLKQREEVPTWSR
jgi:multicomponent Na+:H+ antiporter subunit E